MTVTGLVLQGGGALGAFELGAIECMLDRDVKPDIVSGVSIGAINASTLCGHRASDPKTSLRNLWQDFTTVSLPLQPKALNQHMSIFGCPGMYQPRTDYWNVPNWTSFYDTSPLVGTLNKHIDFDKLKPSYEPTSKSKTRRLILTATNIYTGKLESFDSKHMQILPDHVRASGSLPPGFPATKAPAPSNSGGSQHMHIYWDGGLFDNTPLSMVIHALQEHEEDPDKRLYIISLFPAAIAEAPENMHDVFTRMMTLAFSRKIEQDLKRARDTTDLIHFTMELDELIDTHADLEWLKDLKDMRGYKVLKDFQAPLKIIEVVNPSVNGASDFSKEGIERRRESGYQMMSAKIDELLEEEEKSRKQKLQELGVEKEKLQTLPEGEEKVQKLVNLHFEEEKLREALNVRP